MRKFGRNLTKYIVMTAVFTALGFALTLLEIPMPEPISFLKLDFSNLTTMLCGFTLGPVAMILSEGAKQLLCLTTTTSGGAGQVANFCVAVAYAIVPAILYRFKKGKASVLIGMSVGCVLMTGAALLVNRFISFPMYMGGGAAAAFESLWVYLVAFNLAKSIIISAITFIVYKRLSKALKKWFGEPAKEKVLAENSEKIKENSEEIVAEMVKTEENLSESEVENAENNN